ncbi:MAG: universal stress protein [Gemmatimonadota bacterium]
MPLIERVLAATDGSEYGAKAVQTGAALSRRAGASFEVVTIVEVLMLPPVAMAPPAEALEYDDAFTTEALRKAEAQARDADQAEAPIHVYSGFPAPLISRVADERAADLIVLGAHPHPAVARFLVGNTAERVIRTARRPVLVAIEPRTEPFRRILVAVDLSTQSRRVLRAAAAIAKADGAELRALYAREPLPPMLLESGLFVEESYPGLGPDDLAESIAVAELRDIRVEPRVREGRAGDAVLEETAEWDADLVVIGSHGFGFFERLLLGSTSIHILRHSRRATVIVPPIEGE